MCRMLRWNSSLNTRKNTITSRSTAELRFQARPLSQPSGVSKTRRVSVVLMDRPPGQVEQEPTRSQNWHGEDSPAPDLVRRSFFDALQPASALCFTSQSSSPHSGLAMPPLSVFPPRTAIWNPVQWPRDSNLDPYGEGGPLLNVAGRARPLPTCLLPLETA